MLSEHGHLGAKIWWGTNRWDVLLRNVRGQDLPVPRPAIFMAWFEQLTFLHVLRVSPLPKGGNHLQSTHSWEVTAVIHGKCQKFAFLAQAALSKGKPQLASAGCWTQEIDELAIRPNPIFHRITISKMFATKLPAGATSRETRTGSSSWISDWLIQNPVEEIDEL